MKKSLQIILRILILVFGITLLIIIITDDFNLFLLAFIGASVGNHFYKKNYKIMEKDTYIGCFYSALILIWFIGWFFETTSIYSFYILLLRFIYVIYDVVIRDFKNFKEFIYDYVGDYVGWIRNWILNVE
jgi:hypothetical protein